MFSIFKKKSNNAVRSLEGLSCDVHSHLIPGIDDGAPDMETSLRLISGLVALGYKKIITTPHINGDVFPNTPAVIRAGAAAVTEQLRQRNIDVEFGAAAEHLMDDHFTRALAAGEPFLTLKDNLILVELSFVVPAINLKEILFQLQLKGYQPVLAHPERYLYFGANKGWYDQLRDSGCLFQLNLLSFSGYYGREPQQLAEYLVKKNYVELLGTDLHHEKHLHMLETSTRLHSTVNRLMDTGLIRNPTL
ncbi:tyrosine-protein phosphatase [Puia dinghuensis]|uniref:protein-tyrosine-phosphatase n=1 Tax=Puia dinghuensis TaxID=1792502 RepID=A0A8J2UF58_9BACT|nr:CpsB/CapC family capsule biosynthesis tyrosine phosphatase [Puia dinghuensis]GGB08389.1 capsular polysaccharide biosynthesis protein [Puia dinghuensis]